MNVITITNLWKEYRLGVIGHGTLTYDLQSWWAKVRGKDDPNARINQMLQGQENQIVGDRFWALQDINLDVKQGQVLGIIGKNGAGKSTLLKVLSRVTAPSRGAIKVRGRIASLLEVGTGFHPELTGRENVYLNGAILGMSRFEVKRKFDEILSFSGIEKFIDTPVKRYSSGMYVRLAFAVAAHLEPEILVVDEVLAVGDVEFQKKCLGKMGKIAHEGRTVLFVSHNLGAVANLCSDVALIKSGMINEVGSAQEVVSKYLLSAEEECDDSIESSDERSGNQKVVFSDFYVENEAGEKVVMTTASEISIFVFCIIVKDSKYSKIDIGFSLHDQMDSILSVLYSSYQDVFFSNLAVGRHEVRVKMFGVPIGSSRVGVRGRITVDGDEADWPKKYLGYFEVSRGDFYSTGKGGFDSPTPLLLKGQWE